MKREAEANSRADVIVVILTTKAKTVVIWNRKDEDVLSFVLEITI